MLRFQKEIPAKAVELTVDEVTISMVNKMVYINVNDGDSNRVEAISLLDIFKSEDTLLIAALREVVSSIIDIKYEVDTSLSKGDLFKETENELIPEWDSNQNWTTYTLGDKRRSDGKTYELINVGFSYHEPSGEHGHHGWQLIP